MVASGGVVRLPGHRYALRSASTYKILP
jgi:hypothetical protein